MTIFLRSTRFFTVFNFPLEALSETAFSEVVVQNFPTAGHEVVLRWEQSLQNFVIVEES